MVDVVIIGKGPAGISSSLYTVRGNLSTLVVAKDFGGLYKTDKIDNYYGFPETITGKELMDNGVKQAKRLGVEFAEDEIVDITYDGSFNVIGNRGTYKAMAVILAVGQPGRKLSLKGIKDFEGKGISYCSTCDGFFYRDKKVGVIGYTDFAVHEASELLTYTKDITLFTNGRDLEIDEQSKDILQQLKVNNKPIAGIGGGDYVEEVEFTDGTSESVGGVFIAYGSASALSFALKMGVLTENNAVVVDKDGSTNIPGLFACGDCTGTFKQISVAVGQGAMAGKAVLDYVKKLKK
ncbi:MAG TPA: NAD(P)/FAD-dependent oxidoreductase [Clostridiales bacterium]|nr:NAD(P)/FAD-dependent oxidoreductase [Clostridiales bacterium]